MRNLVILFFAGFLVAFGGGYFFYDSKAATNDHGSEHVADAPEAKQDSQDKKEGSTALAEGQIFIEKGCTGCHAVSALQVDGSQMGADLSTAYNHVEGKFGIPIEQYLKEPNSAVMSGVMAGNPLTDEELERVIEGLRKAANQ